MEQMVPVDLTGIYVDVSENKILRGFNSQLVMEEDVDTEMGSMNVVVQGHRGLPAIITFHDIGLNHDSCFGAFFQREDISRILSSFCVYHVNAPGQHKNAPTFVDEMQFPSMGQLAEMVLAVCQHYKLHRFIGFGVGAGAYVLSLVGEKAPAMVDGLVLINGVGGTSSWSEWGYHKMSNYYLRKQGMTTFSQDYLLWHHFGNKTQEDNHDLIYIHKENLRTTNARNLAAFCEAWVLRPALNPPRQLKYDVLLLTGKSAPHKEATVAMNAKMDHARVSYFEVSSCGGMALDEQPRKVVEAFLLFLQGMGLVTGIHLKSLSESDNQNRRKIAGIIQSEISI